MISSYLTMQNAVLARNTAVFNMMNTSNNMMQSVSFGNSQPLKPSFSQLNTSELQMKADETKVSVLNKLIEALKAKLAKDVKKSTPKYAGLDYKA